MSGIFLVPTHDSERRTASIRWLPKLELQPRLSRWVPAASPTSHAAVSWHLLRELMIPTPSSSLGPPRPINDIIVDLIAQAHTPGGPFDSSLYLMVPHLQLPHQ